MRVVRDAAGNFARDDLYSLAVDVGLSEAAPSLSRLARWGMQLVSVDLRAETGRSKIGGFPDLPATLDWPTSPAVRSLFLAQIAVDDIPVEWLGLGRRLEGVSLILFFAFQHVVTREVIGGRALPVGPGSDLERVAVHDFTHGIVENERALAMRPVLTLPKWRVRGDFPSREIGLGDEDRDTYVRLLSAIERAQRVESPRHRLLGHPDRILDPVLQEAALMEAWDNRAEWYSPETLQAQAKEWRLLLRLDSESAPGIEWPRGGTVYFCIPANRLREARFEFVQAFTGPNGVESGHPR